ncbi:MAG: hypothetical protein SH807_04795 [Blastochloris sp.]|nr:hypothetical protein [Blastochloris sp.]
MASSILNSPKAVAMSVYVIRTIIRLREEFAANTSLGKRLAVIEKTLLAHETTLHTLSRKLAPCFYDHAKLPAKRWVST